MRSLKTAEVEAKATCQQAKAAAKQAWVDGEQDTEDRQRSTGSLGAIVPSVGPVGGV
jgi:hypothetical protein